LVVGDLVGNNVGFNDGELVGDIVGFNVGDLVGDADGCTEGSVVVGLGDGAFVGLAVVGGITHSPTSFQTAVQFILPSCFGATFAQ